MSGSQTDKLKSLYIDKTKGTSDINPDDFIVAIGKKQSNSVYHVAVSVKKDSPKHPRMNRFHVKVYKTDLIVALNRDCDQQLIPMTWYSRSKKKHM